MTWGRMSSFWRRRPSYASLGVQNPAISGGGGSTSMNGGHLDYPVDPALGATYLYQTSWGATPMEHLSGVGKCRQPDSGLAHPDGNKVHYQRRGAGFPLVAGASTINSGSIAGGGFAFFTALDAAVTEQKHPGHVQHPGNRPDSESNDEGGPRRPGPRLRQRDAEHQRPIGPSCSAPAA